VLITNVKCRYHVDTGTHLYVLYESYGYSVASLYSLGFVVGAVTSPFIGPVVDKIGRKRSAILYCLLEMFINYLELYPIFAGLIVSRMIGGITTNLLFSVFESWLVSEHRSRGFHDDDLEIILRDSTIVSNGAAIFSGYLSHCLAEAYGNGGPFRGAVGCTFFACMVVFSLWNENFGSLKDTSSELNTWRENMGKSLQ
jgi:MFS transporter, MFS domain-containing protein family, molybdate-anion transporter